MIKRFLQLLTHTFFTVDIHALNFHNFNERRKNHFWNLSALPCWISLPTPPHSPPLPPSIPCHQPLIYSFLACLLGTKASLSQSKLSAVACYKWQHPVCNLCELWVVGPHSVYVQDSGMFQQTRPYPTADHKPSKYQRNSTYACTQTTAQFTLYCILQTNQLSRLGSA